MLEKILQELGLGHKEQTIYKLILERGKIAPAQLSRLTKINRTTVYSVAKELKEKGLIVEDLGGRTLYYLPVRENELEKILKQEEEKLESKKKSIFELQELLKQTPSSQTFSIPKIRFIDEVDLEKYLEEAIPRWHNSMMLGEKTWWGFQDPTYVELFKNKFIDSYWNKYNDGNKLKIITNDTKVEKEMQKTNYSDRRQIKFIKDNEFTATQWVIGDYVIYLMTKQRPFYLVEIHDSVIAHNSAELFKRIWEGL